MDIVPNPPTSSPGEDAQGKSRPSVSRKQRTSALSEAAGAPLAGAPPELPPGPPPAAERRVTFVEGDEDAGPPPEPFFPDTFKQQMNVKGQAGMELSAISAALENQDARTEAVLLRYQGIADMPLARPLNPTTEVIPVSPMDKKRRAEVYGSMRQHFMSDHFNEMYLKRKQTITKRYTAVETAFESEEEGDD